MTAERDVQFSVPAQNDPWAPSQPMIGGVPLIPGAPTDPLRDTISSEKYLQSLEKKLSHLKGKQSKPVTAHELIQTLTKAKEDQMTHFLTGRETVDDTETDFQTSDSTLFSLQRRLNPEKQAINPQELFPLVQNDVLAKTTEEYGDLEAGRAISDMKVTIKDSVENKS